MSASDGLLLDCVSNSSQSGVGMITGLDGNTLPTGNTGVWNVVNPFSSPGVIRLQTILSLTATDQGIYTCTIPDSNDTQFIINVGLYPSGFIGKLYTYDYSLISRLFRLDIYSYDCSVFPGQNLIYYM